MVDDLRYKRLTNAKSLALEGDYKAAYDILEVLHQKYPQDLEVRRLYGNVLELEAFALEVTRPMDDRLRRARKHYAFILRASKYDRVAMFDLAEHFSNINKLRVARCLFGEVLARYENDSSDEVSRAKERLEEMKSNEA